MTAGTCSSISVTMINGHGLNSCIKKKDSHIEEKLQPYILFQRSKYREVKNKERQKGI